MRTDHDGLELVRRALVAAGAAIVKAKLITVPTSQIELLPRESFQLLRLIESLQPLGMT